MFRSGCGSRLCCLHRPCPLRSNYQRQNHLLTRVWLDSARAGAGKIVLAVRANSTPTQRLVLAHNEVQIRYICMGNI